MTVRSNDIILGWRGEQRPVVLADGEISIEKNCVRSLKDECFICCFGHFLQIVNDLPTILVNSVLLSLREVESCLKIVSRVSSSAQVKEGETGEDTEGRDDDVLPTVFAGSLKLLVKINKKSAAGSDG